MRQPSPCAVRGSSAVIPCSLTPPAGQTATEVFWLIYASHGTEPSYIAENPSYTGRVEYYWEKNNKKNNNKANCTDGTEGIKD